ncbi:DNA adenine methylase [bacterium]|jgi:adenine-specific DNA-methyltransferase|nr:DNA adenine methylase [bacterium]
MEKKEYLTKHLITYIGNKRTLLNFIGKGLDIVKNDLGKDKLMTFDGFAGSGVVSRFLKQHSHTLFSNDYEYYSYLIGDTYLTNKSNVDINYITNIINELNEKKFRTDLGPGIIETLYAPKETTNIQLGERTFYTNENAKIIDNIRRTIDEIVEDENMKKFFISPLLIKSSIHNNTSGVFKGFYKDSETGIGKFGGNGENALERIKGEINIDIPIFSEYECYTKVFNMDINKLIIDMEETMDVTYYDPPYNQHPYGSNYFMLNVIAKYEEPKDISNVSGIPKDWKKSAYNKRNDAIESFDHLIKNTKSKFILLSYNNEGIINTEELKSIMGKYGDIDLIKQEYNTFRGSRNLKDRSNKVDELLYILKKK